MAEAWQVLEFQPNWLGLHSRSQKAEVSRLAAEISRNVSYYGAVLAKRGAQQFLTAFRTSMTAPSNSVTITVADVSGLEIRAWVNLFDPATGAYWEGQIASVGAFSFTLTIAPPTGFGIGSVVVRRMPIHATRVLSSTGADFDALFLPLAVADFQYYPPGTEVVARHYATLTTLIITGLTAPATFKYTGTQPVVGDEVYVRLDGLFQAVYRDQSRKLLAVAGGGVFEAGATPAPVTLDYPSTTTAAVPSVGTGWTGALGSYETLLVGDRVTLQFATGFYAGTVTALTLGVSVTVLLDIAPVASNPTHLIHRPTRMAGDTTFAQYADVTHIAAENAPPAKYTGAKLQRHGIMPPTSAITATASATAGVLTGAYNYRGRFKNSTTGQESEAGFVVGADGTIDIPVALLKSGTASPAAHKIDLTTIPISPDPQVDKVALYRTLAGGDGRWFFLDEVNNGVTTYTDNIPDTRLGREMRQFLDEPLPDTAVSIAVWPQANRLLAILPDLDALVYSDIFELDSGFLKGESWPSDNLIFVNYDDGDRLRAVVPLQSSVLVFKERSIWRVDGTPDNLTISAVSFRSDLTGIGIIGPKAFAVDQDSVRFAAQDGVYEITRRQFTSDFESQRLSSGIDDEWARLTITQRARAHMAYFRRLRQTRCWLPVDGLTEPTECVVLQAEGQLNGTPSGWSLWDIHRSDIAEFLASMLDLVPARVTASCIAQTDTGDVNYIGTDRSEVLLMDQGTADMEAFPSLYDYATMAFAPGGMGRPCRSRAVDTILTAIAGGAVTLELAYDFGDRASKKVLAFAPSGGFILDTSHLDVDTLGGTRPRTYNRVMLGRGEYHRIRYTEFSNTAAFAILAFNYWIQVLSVPALSRVEG